MSRPQRIAYESLVIRLTEYRSQGWSCKQIGSELGYSADWIRHLCSSWNIKKRFKRETEIDQRQVSCEPSSRDVTAEELPHEVAAASEAKPSDTPPPGSHA